MEDNWSLQKALTCAHDRTENGVAMWIFQVFSKEKKSNYLFASHMTDKTKKKERRKS